MEPHALLLTATLPVALLLIIALIQKGGFQRKEHTILILFLLNYTLALIDKVREETGLFHYDYWDRLYLTPWFAFGPLIYLYFRATLLPAKKSLPYHLQYIIFLPALVELLHSIAVWVASWALADAHPIHGWLDEWVDPINTLSFYYMISFVLLSLVFLLRQRAFKKYQILYRHKLNWLAYFGGFMIIIIAAELLSYNSTVPLLYYPVCLFIYLLAFRMMMDATLFSSHDALYKEWLKQALQEAERAVVIINAADEVIYTNTTFLTISGYTRKELTGKKLFNRLYGPLTPVNGIQQLDAQRAAALPAEAELICYRKAGEAYHSHLTLIPVPSARQTHYIVYLADRGTVASAAPDKKEQRLLEQLQQWLTDPAWYGNAQLQQSDVATALGISSRALGELLSKYTELTFPQWLSEARVEGAQQILINPQQDHLAVMELATQVGFSSKTAFYTAFKKKMGMTPTDYRNQQKKATK